MNLLGYDLNCDFSLQVDKYYAYDYDYFNMLLHAHLNAELMCAESGECEIYAGEKPERLRRGHFFLAFSGVPHRLSVKRGSRCKILNVELRPAPYQCGLNISQIASSSAPLSESYQGMPAYFIAADTAHVADTVRSMHRELTASGYNLESGYRVQALILELLIAAARSYQNNRGNSLSYIRKAQDFIRNEYANNVGAREVAESVGLNPVYLQRQIKKHTGKTILEHINFYRIGQAKKLMENTALPLVDISAECGFNSRQSFYETFIKAEGVSPRAFRSALRMSAASRYRQADFEWEQD